MSSGKNEIAVCSSLGARHFKQLNFSKNTSKILCDNNRIKTFEGLPDLNSLSDIDLENNAIQSFKGIPKLNRLKALNLKGNPISRHTHFRLMAAIVFNRPILINNEPLMKSTLDKAKDLVETVRSLLVDEGKILLSVKPLKLFDPETNEYTEINSKIPSSVAVEQAKPSIAVLCRRIVKHEIEISDEDKQKVAEAVRGFSD